VTRALCGLSHLNVWWMRLGIQHQRIHPASPKENGAHERMHRTLKRGAIRPPKATMRSQQRAFDAFRTEYNQERPHSHHGGAPPGDHYVASSREYPSRLPALEYPGHFTVKRVTTVGTFRFKTKLLFIANALRGYHIGLDEEADGRSTSATSCWRSSMNGITSSGNDRAPSPSVTHVPGLKCYLSPRLFTLGNEQ
jgi:putative transposase